MLNALGRASDGRPLIMLGLTGENITRLMAAEPILLDMHDDRFGVAPTQIMIVAARDEHILAAQLRSSGLMPACCSSHGAVCVTPAERCCRACPEATHGDHPLGVHCVLDAPDSAGPPGRTARGYGGLRT